MYQFTRPGLLPGNLETRLDFRTKDYWPKTALHGVGCTTFCYLLIFMEVKMSQYTVECKKCDCLFVPGGKEMTDICAGCYKQMLEDLDTGKTVATLAAGWRTQAAIKQNSAQEQGSQVNEAYVRRMAAAKVLNKCAFELERRSR